MKKIIKYFSIGEWILWAASVASIVVFFCIFDKHDYLKLTASIIGVTSLIFAAKGNPLGPVLMIVFCILYGIISYSYKYYGEMATYLGMTLPMSVFSLIVWLKNPFKGNKSQVTINVVKGKEWIFLTFLTVAVTVGFYFLLRYLNTNNLIVSTVSVATSFIAAYLTLRRSAGFALAYAVNDLVLIVLWAFATKENPAYAQVVACFCTFFINDVYGYVNWKRIYKRQNVSSKQE